MNSDLPKSSNLPSKWDLETDVISVGSGAAGMAMAISAHDHGLRAVVLERSSQVGGVTAYSFGQVWIAGNHLATALGLKDSAQSGYRYLKRLGMEYVDEAASLNLAVHAPVALRYFEEKIGLRMRVVRDLPDYYWPQEDSVGEGRILEVLPFPAASLGEWQAKTRVSPLVPYGLTMEDMFGKGGPAKILDWDFGIMAGRLANDERCLGPGLACYFVKGVVDRGIPMLTDVNVEQLLSDGRRIVGVRASTNKGDFFVKANRGVLLATGSYERSKDYTRSLGHQLDLQTMLMPTVDGAHFRLAGPMGARVVSVPDVTMLGYTIPGEEQEGDLPLWRNAMSELGMPHTLVANRAGRRFADESFYRSLYFAMDYIDGAKQVHPNFPCWAIFDSQARAKYPFGSLMPGQGVPDALGVTADSIEELAVKAGIDPRGLSETIRTFNDYSGKGVDPEFGRGTSPWGAYMSGDRDNKPNQNLGPLLKPPFYAIRLHRLGGGGISSAGLPGRHELSGDWMGRQANRWFVRGRKFDGEAGYGVGDAKRFVKRERVHPGLPHRPTRVGAPKHIALRGAWADRAFMIRHDQSITIEAGIDDVWGYTGDMQKWGSFMPAASRSTSSMSVIPVGPSKWGSALWFAR